MLFFYLAAHCITDTNSGDIVPADHFKVRVGLQSLDEENIAGKTFPVLEIFRHPQYDTKMFINDVAILKVAGSMLSIDGAEMVCIDYTNKLYDYLYITGFGGTSISKKTTDGAETVESTEKGNEYECPTQQLQSQNSN